MRLNKLDSQSLASSLSRDSRKLHNHPQLFPSFHDEPPGHLIFGYTKRLNEQRVAVLDRVLLTLETEDGVMWWTYIDDEAAAVTPVESPPSPAPPIVRPKALPGAKKVDGESERCGESHLRLLDARTRL